MRVQTPQSESYKPERYQRDSVREATVAAIGNISGGFRPHRRPLRVSCGSRWRQWLAGLHRSCYSIFMYFRFLAYRLIVFRRYLQASTRPGRGAVGSTRTAVSGDAVSSGSSSSKVLKSSQAKSCQVKTSSPSGLVVLFILSTVYLYCTEII